jgi:hypothetical protein
MPQVTDFNHHGKIHMSSSYGRAYHKDVEQAREGGIGYVARCQSIFFACSRSLSFLT